MLATLDPHAASQLAQNLECQLGIAFNQSSFDNASCISEAVISPLSTIRVGRTPGGIEDNHYEWWRRRKLMWRHRPTSKLQPCFSVVNLTLLIVQTVLFCRRFYFFKRNFLNRQQQRNFWCWLPAVQACELNWPRKPRSTVGWIFFASDELTKPLYQFTWLSSWPIKNRPSDNLNMSKYLMRDFNKHCCWWIQMLIQLVS